MGDFLDPSHEIHRHGDRRPHWEQGEAMQFVTFRLGDAMPQEKLTLWKAQRRIWLTHHPLPWSPETEAEYHHEFTRKLERWLDEGAGSCLFQDEGHRRILERTLMHDHGHRAEHHAWVIMPNHVHLLFAPKYPLKKLLQSWKGVSARNLGRGSIWQKNYRDTLIRDQDHFENAVRYIRRNPAKLPRGSFTLWQSERALRVP
jgi:REP element-mobilizing transposase RayT